MNADTASGFMGFLSSYGIIIIMIVVLVVVMILPQRKREKKIKDMLASIKPGDRVRTIGGIYGTVTKVNEDTIFLTVGPDKTVLVFHRQAIATIEDSAVENTMENAIKE